VRITPQLDQASAWGPMLTCKLPVTGSAVAPTRSTGPMASYARRCTGSSGRTASMGVTGSSEPVPACCIRPGLVCRPTPSARSSGRRICCSKPTKSVSSIAGDNRANPNARPKPALGSHPEGKEEPRAHPGPDRRPSTPPGLRRHPGAHLGSAVARRAARR
jgi:hypothetical protein